HSTKGPVTYRESGRFRVVWRVPVSALTTGRRFLSSTATVVGTTSVSYDNSAQRGCRGILVPRHEPFVLRVISSSASSVGLIASPSPIATATSLGCAQGLRAARWRLTVSSTHPPYRSSSQTRRTMWWVYNHPGFGFHGTDFTPIPKGGVSGGGGGGGGPAGAFNWLAVVSIRHTTGPAAPTAVSFRATDGTKLRGATFGVGPAGIVIAHDADSNYSEWEPAAQLL